MTPAEGLVLAAGLLKAIDVLIDRLAELGAETADIRAAALAEQSRIKTQQTQYEAEAAKAMGLGPIL